MHNTEYNKQNQDNDNQHNKKRRQITDEESALRHVFLLFLVFAGLIGFSLNSSYKSMTDILDENYVYPFDLDNLDERRRNLEEELDNTFGGNKDTSLDRHRRRSKDTPLEDLIASYQLTPHIEVGADEYSGVDKEISNYVWQLLKLDDALTSQITNRVIIYQNQNDENAKDTLDEIDKLIDAYKDDIDNLALPQGIKTKTAKSLENARDRLIERHDNLREAFEAVSKDPKDTAKKVNELVAEIEENRDVAARNLIDALRSAKKF